MTLFPPRVNSDTTLCYACLAIFASQTEPTPRGDEIFPLPEHSAHHPSVASFRTAVADGCTICRVVDKTFQENSEEIKGTEVMADLFKGVPAATTYTLTGESKANHYLLAIFLNVNGLGSVTYLSVANIAPGTVVNVPPAQHTALLKQWTLGCCTGAGRHTACQAYRNAVLIRNLQGPRRLIQLCADGSDEHGEEIVFRLQSFDNFADGGIGAGVAYATVSHVDGPVPDSNDRYLLLLQEMKAKGYLYTNWQTIKLLPTWLQQAAKATHTAGVTYLWAPMHLLGGDSPQGSFYAKAVFNIAVLEKAFTASDDTHSVEQLPIVHPGWADDRRHVLAVYEPSTFYSSLATSPLAASADFHRAVLLSPATLFLEGQGRIWWQCTEGTLYGDLLATGAGEHSPSALGIYGTHGSNTDDWWRRLQVVVHSDSGRESGELALRLAGFWTTVVSNYAHNVPTTAANRAAVIDDVAALVRRLLSSSSSPSTINLSYTHGIWSDGLVEQLAWKRKDGHALAPPHRPHLVDDGKKVPSWSWLGVGSPVGYQFLLAIGSPAIRVNGMSDDAPRARRVATASLWGDSQKGSVVVLATGRLLSASLDRSVPLEQGQLIVTGIPEGLSSVIWDAAEDLLCAKDEADGGSKYFVWPLFAQVYDGGGGQVGARGLVLRQQSDGDGIGMLYRCGWYEYMLRCESSAVSPGGSNAIVELAQGDESQHVQFVMV